MRRMLRFAIVVMGAFAVSGPALAAENWPDSFSDYIAKLRRTLQTTDLDGYVAVVKDPKGALLIDVREEDEFKSGHVPGTINIPRGLLELRIWRAAGYPGNLDTGRKIYVQCGSGGRATLAARDLKEIGFTNVVAVLITLDDWQKNGNRLVK